MCTEWIFYFRSRGFRARKTCSRLEQRVSALNAQLLLGGLRVQKKWFWCTRKSLCIESKFYMREQNSCGHGRCAAIENSMSCRRWCNISHLHMQFFRESVPVLIWYDERSCRQCWFCDSNHRHYIVRRICKTKRKGTLGGIRDQEKPQKRPFLNELV